MGECLKYEKWNNEKWARKYEKRKIKIEKNEDENFQPFI